MKKKTKITLWSAIAVVVVGILCAEYMQKELVRRHLTFAGYANAVGMYFIEGNPLPDNVSEIESTYNKWESARATLPEAPHHLHPIYRPPTGLVGGPFLLFIEPPPPGSLLPFTMLIWANADGSNIRVDQVFNWKLKETLRQDDARRQTSRKPG